MKNIKDFIIESYNEVQLNENKEAIEQILSTKKCPLDNEDFYDKYDLYSYATVPNVKGFADQFKLDYVGKYWALSQEVNAFEDADQLPLTMLPYSYAPGDESLEDFDYYNNEWEKASDVQKKKTINKIKRGIKENS